MPFVPPIQRLPSRSSNSAVTPASAEDSPGMRDETPLALNRRKPRVVPTQMLESRSRIKEATATCRRDDGTPSRDRLVPFQRHTPLLVPANNSEFSIGRRQLTLTSPNPFTAVTAPPFGR